VPPRPRLSPQCHWCSSRALLAPKPAARCDSRSSTQLPADARIRGSFAKAGSPSEANELPAASRHRIQRSRVASDAAVSARAVGAMRGGARPRARRARTLPRRWDERRRGRPCSLRSTRPARIREAERVAVEDREQARAEGACRRSASRAGTRRCSGTFRPLRRARRRCDRTGALLQAPPASSSRRSPA
jgi:hypothetical protein